MNNGNGEWANCKREIYHRFEETDQKLDKLVTAIEVLTAKLNTESTNHKLFEKEMRMKSSISGAIAGTIPSLIVIILWVLKELLLK